MCAPLAVVGAGIAAAGTLVGGVQSLMQGNYQAKVAKQNATMDADAARESVLHGQDDALQFWRQTGQLKGSQVAEMAANGIDPSFGSALRLQMDTAALAQEDASRIYKNAGEQSKGYLIRSMNSRAEASADRAAGVSALVGSVFQAGSSLMGSMSQQSALKAKFGVVGSGDVRGMIRHASPGVF